MSHPRIRALGDCDAGTLRCENLVIGTGAGGSVAGEMLAAAGRDVVFLEEGGLHRPEDHTDDIGKMTAALYRDGGVTPILGLPPIGFAEGRCVGGGTVINGGLIWRTPEWVLDEWQQSYGLDGYDADTLAPHFEQIERDLNVIRRERDSDANLDSMRLLAGADVLGWKHVMIPHAVRDCDNRNLCPTGCTSGAKQTMLETLLPRALDHGARIFTGARARRILYEGDRVEGVEVVAEGRPEPVTIRCDELTIAGGAVQTPHLLQRSGLGPRFGSPLQFHLNLKMVARYPEQIDAHRGAMFTVQVQEYEREGMLFMASNLQPHYVAMTLSQYEPAVINSLLDSYDRLGLYVAMFRPRSRGRVLSWTGGRPTVVYRFDPYDLGQARAALRRAARLLFAAGAVELFLPLRRGRRVSSPDEVERSIEGLSPRDLELITVHAMASCPMGADPRDSSVDLLGRLRGMQNVSIADASILPGNIGESPQGTIMAFVRNSTGRRLAGSR